MQVFNIYLSRIKNVVLTEGKKFVSLYNMQILLPAPCICNKTILAFYSHFRFYGLYEHFIGT